MRGRDRPAGGRKEGEKRSGMGTGTLESEERSRSRFEGGAEIALLGSRDEYRDMVSYFGRGRADCGPG